MRTFVFCYLGAGLLCKFFVGGGFCTEPQTQPNLCFFSLAPLSYVYTIIKTRVVR